MKGIKKKVLARPEPMSQPILADPRWTGGSHCNPQLTIEVAEVVQGVEDELPLQGILAEVVLIPQKIRLEVAKLFLNLRKLGIP